MFASLQSSTLHCWHSAAYFGILPPPVDIWNSVTTYAHMQMVNKAESKVYEDVWPADVLKHEVNTD